MGGPPTREDWSHTRRSPRAAPVPAADRSRAAREFRFARTAARRAPPLVHLRSHRETADGEFSTRINRWANIGLAFEPRSEFHQPLLKLHPRFVSKNVTRQRNIRETMPDVPDAVLPGDFWF